MTHHKSIDAARANDSYAIVSASYWDALHALSGTDIDAYVWFGNETVIVSGFEVEAAVRHLSDTFGAEFTAAIVYRD